MSDGQAFEASSFTSKAPSALVGYLVGCGVDREAACILSLLVEQTGLMGLDSDGLAGVLLRSVGRCSRAAYREGYEDASELLAGIRQSPLVLPAVPGEDEDRFADSE